LNIHSRIKEKITICSVYSIRIRKYVNCLQYWDNEFDKRGTSKHFYTYSSLGLLLGIVEGEKTFFASV